MPNQFPSLAAAMTATIDNLQLLQLKEADYWISEGMRCFADAKRCIEAAETTEEKMDLATALFTVVEALVNDVRAIDAGFEGRGPDDTAFAEALMKSARIGNQAAIMLLDNGGWY